MVTPFALLTGLYINYDHIHNNQSPIFVRRFGSLISEFHQNRGFKCMLYYPLFTLRRIVYIISQVYLSNYPILQKSSNLGFGLITFFYLIIVKPYKEKIILISNCVSEGLICLIFAQILFMQFNSNLLSEDSLNYIFICVLISCLGFQYIISLIVVGSQILEIFKKCMKRNNLSKFDAPETFQKPNFLVSISR